MTLLRRIEAYLERSGTTATAFGREVLGDPSFVADLRRGRTPGRRTIARVEARLEETGSCER